MFLPTNATVKLAHGNTGHAQGIGIILCRFPNCSIIYPVGPVYYCPGHPSNTMKNARFVSRLPVEGGHTEQIQIQYLFTRRRGGLASSRHWTVVRARGAG